jgi:hypothetical protein
VPLLRPLHGTEPQQISLSRGAHLYQREKKSVKEKAVSYKTDGAFFY